MTDQLSEDYTEDISGRSFIDLPHFPGIRNELLSEAVFQPAPALIVN